MPKLSTFQHGMVRNHKKMGVKIIHINNLLRSHFDSRAVTSQQFYYVLYAVTSSVPNIFCGCYYRLEPLTTVLQRMFKIRTQEATVKQN